MNKRTIIIITAAAVCVLAVILVITLNIAPKGGESVPEPQSVPEFIMPEPPDSSTSNSATPAVSISPEPESEELVTLPSESTQAVPEPTSEHEQAEQTEQTSPPEQPEQQETSAATTRGITSDTTPAAVTTTERTAVTTAKTSVTTAATSAPETTKPEIKPEPEIQKNVLVTSGDPQHHIRFVFGESKISFSGIYTGTNVSDVEILRKHISSYDMKAGESFSGTLNVSGLTPGYYIIRVTLSNGAIMDYVFEMTAGGSAPLSWEELPADENLSAAASPLELPAAGVMQHITSSGDPAKAEQILAQVRELSDEICAGLTDDYSKARALAQWVSRNMYYDSDASENGVSDDMVTLEHVLEYHRSVCFGWSNLYAALCQAQGIWCANASGSVVTGSRCFMQTTTEDERSHSWNMVVIDGRQIWVDTVWDSSNSYKNGRYVDGSQDMQYFDITALALSQDHRVMRFEHRDYFAVS